MKVKTNRTRAQIARAIEVRERERLVLEERRERQRVEAGALVERMNETETLAQARGEQVERAPSGSMRVIDRDALLPLIRGGHLSPDEFDLAVDIRALYERQSEDAGALQYGDSGRGAHDNATFVFNRLQRAKALTRLGRIEREIAVKCRDEPAALQMFRGVLGQNLAVSSFGKGSAFARNVRALRRALAVAEDIKG